MDEREQRKRKERSDLIWTFLIIGAFIMMWPLGLVLAILKGKNLLPTLGMGTPTRKEDWRTAQQEPPRTRQAPQPSHAQQWTPQMEAQMERTRKQAEYWAEQARQQAERSRQRAAQWAVPVNSAPTQKQREKQLRQQEKQQQAKQSKLRFGKPMLITGLSLGAVGAISFADAMSSVSSFSGFLSDGFFPFGLLAVGIYLTVYGFLRARQSKRLQEYAAIIQPNSTYYSIHELADRTGRSYRQVTADLQKMIELGIWERAWIDRKHGRLMFTDYSAEQLVREEPVRAATPPPAEDTRAEEVLRRIRADNDIIADEEISRKIDRIELLTGQIFRYLAKHPEREGDLRTFMDYYLPQTLKILETYAHLEAQGVETDNIRRAKAEISAMLDQLTESYERQLDKLFATDVVDISADIEVMRQMLRNDGLAADQLEFELERVQRNG